MLGYPCRWIMETVMDRKTKRPEPLPDEWIQRTIRNAKAPNAELCELAHDAEAAEMVSTEDNRINPNYELIFKNAGKLLHGWHQIYWFRRIRLELGTAQTADGNVDEAALSIIEDNIRKWARVLSNEIYRTLMVVYPLRNKRNMVRGVCVLTEN